MSLDEDTQEEYDKRFGLKEVREFREAGITPKKVKELPENLLKRSHWDILRILTSGHSPVLIAEYVKEGFSDIGMIIRLIEADFHIEIAKEYPIEYKKGPIGPMSIHLIFDLLKELDFLPGMVKEHIKKVFEKYRTDHIESYSNETKIAILELFKNGVCPGDMTDFNKDLCYEHIIELKRLGFSGKQTKGYKHKDTNHIFQLVLGKIPPSIANQYSTEFSGATIAEAVTAGYSNDVLKEYPGRFKDSIFNLVKERCHPQIASRYHPDIPGSTVATLHAMRMTPEEANQNKPFLQDLAYVAGLIDREHRKNFVFLGTGNQGLIVRIDGEAYKFSKDCENEYKLLRKLAYNNPNTQNLIQLSCTFLIEELKPIADSHEITLCLLLEEFDTSPSQDLGNAYFNYYKHIKVKFICGDTLENNIKKNGSLPKESVLKYASDIMNGLLELRRAEIYHRDIRPSNIMIDEEKDRAVIIDLGIATDDPDAMPQDNRRYGGSDLMSLGQLIYKMVTGHNLFNEYSKPSLEAADDIGRLRKQFCHDKAMREDYLRKVADNVHDKKLVDIIQTCLVAGLRLGEQPLLAPEQIRKQAYAQVKEVFRRYAA